MSDTANYVESIKKYVPGEILAAVLAIDGFIPNDRDLDLYVFFPIIFIFSLCIMGFFVFKKTFSEMRMANLLLSIIAVLLFVSWAGLIASERFVNMTSFPDIKIVMTTLIIMITTILVLFDVNVLSKIQKEQSEGGA